MYVCVWCKYVYWPTDKYKYTAVAGSFIQWDIHFMICSSYNFCKTKRCVCLIVDLRCSTFPEWPTATNIFHKAFSRIKIHFISMVYHVHCVIKWLYTPCVVLLWFSIAFTATTHLHVYLQESNTGSQWLGSSSLICGLLIVIRGKVNCSGKIIHWERRDLTAVKH